MIKANKKDPRGKLLNKCPKESCFKMKVWKHDGRGHTIFSYDYEKERQEFNDPDMIMNLRRRFTEIGLEVFTPYNGFQKMVEHAKKLTEQGNLKKAYIFCNKIRILTPTVSSQPVPVLLCTFDYSA